MKTVAKPADLRTVSEAVVKLDIVNFSFLTGKYGESKAVESKKYLEAIVNRAYQRYSGCSLTREGGDSFFMTFPKEIQATQCVLSILQELQIFNQAVECTDHEIHLHIGITFGQLVIDENGDRFGDAANFSARLEKISPEDLLEVPEGMSRRELKQISGDRILVDWKIDAAIRSAYGQMLHFVGPVLVKGTGVYQTVYWLDCEAIGHAAA